MNSELVSILMERDSGIAEFRGALIVSVTSPKATFFANSARKTDACSALSCGHLEILRLKLLGAVTPQNLVLGVSQRYIVVRMDQVAEAASHLVRIGMRWCSLSLSLSELLFILRRIGYCLEEFTTSTLARSLAVVAIAVFPFLLRSSNQLPLPPRHALLQVSPSFP